MSLSNKSENVNSNEEVYEADFQVSFDGGIDRGISKKKMWYLAVFIVLISAISFGLGRLAFYDNARPNVTISSPLTQDKNGGQVLGTSDSASNDAPSNTNGEVVASKNGTKYHYPWCSGAQRITPTNLITFSSIDEAKKAGYTPASNCKGLK